MEFVSLTISNDFIQAKVRSNMHRFSCIVCGKPLCYAFTESGHSFGFDPETNRIHTQHPAMDVNKAQKEKQKQRHEQAKKEDRKGPVEQKLKPDHD